MNVLLVEDAPERIRWFRARYPSLDVTHDVDHAIWLLQTQAYDLLFLDHDLGTEPKAGRDVATWLVAHPTCHPGLMIVVHSVNVVSAPKIVAELHAAWRTAKWIPFPTLMETPTFA